MSVTFDVPPPPDMNKFYLDIITNLRREYDLAVGKLEVANAIIDKFMEQVSDKVSERIINEVHAEFIPMPHRNPTK